MSSGKFASGVLTGIANEFVYTVPTGFVDTMNIRLSNPTAAPITVSVNIGAGGSPVAADLIVPPQDIIKNGIMEDTGIVAGSGEKVWITSSAAGVVYRLHGHESQ